MCQHHIQSIHKDQSDCPMGTSVTPYLTHTINPANKSNFGKPNNEDGPRSSVPVQEGEEVDTPTAAHGQSKDKACCTCTCCHPLFLFAEGWPLINDCCVDCFNSCKLVYHVLLVHHLLLLNLLLPCYSIEQFKPITTEPTALIVVSSSTNTLYMLNTIYVLDISIIQCLKM